MGKRIGIHLDKALSTLGKRDGTQQVVLIMLLIIAEGSWVRGPTTFSVLHGGYIRKHILETILGVVKDSMAKVREDLTKLK